MADHCGLCSSTRVVLPIRMEKEVGEIDRQECSGVSVTDAWRSLYLGALVLIYATGISSRAADHSRRTSNGVATECMLYTVVSFTLSRPLRRMNASRRKLDGIQLYFEL